MAAKAGGPPSAEVLQRSVPHQKRARTPTRNGSVQRALLSLISSRPVPARPSTWDIPVTYRRPSCPNTPIRSDA